MKYESKQNKGLTLHSELLFSAINFSGTLSECPNSFLDSMLVMSVLIWVQTVCKDRQAVNKANFSLVNISANIISWEKHSSLKFSGRPGCTKNTSL